MIDYHTVADTCDIMGNGYVGRSMSWNASFAYRRNEKPLSKWTKTEIIKILEGYVPKDVSYEKMSIIRKIPLKWLRTLCLYANSWHHTSASYNVTYFYVCKPNGIRDMTISELRSYISRPITSAGLPPMTTRYMPDYSLFVLENDRKR